MNKWDKLNKEFSAVLENLTQEDWLIWERQKSQLIEMRRKILELKSKIQEEKLELLQSSEEQQKILNDWMIPQVELSQISHFNLPPAEICETTQYALAA
jgi:hypothetical protein